jgi:hypothetical protein
MAKTLNELGAKLLAQLYEIVTGGDGQVPRSRDNFLSWCTPGIPFTPEDFAFCVKGLGGGATAEEEKLLVQQAFNFAQAVDFIPDATGVYMQDPQQAIFRTAEERMSHIYGEILRLSKVVASDMTDEEKANLEKFRNLLRVKKESKDLITGEVTEVTQDSPALQAYNDKMSQFITAALAYNSKRVAAQTATGADKAPVLDWTNNEKLYRLQVKAAEDAWTTGGYRNDIDRMNAYINQVTQRSMLLWKQSLLEMYGDAKVAAMGPGQNFFYTSVIPGNFANSAGWTQFAMSHETVDSSTLTKTNGFSVGGGVSFGLFSVGANVRHESSDFKSDYAVSSFKLSFELTQTVISRPWFYPEFFMNRGWTLPKGAGWNYDKWPSDGTIPPDGCFIAYPTTILFARNIVVESADFATAFKAHSSSTQAGASVGWGPFSLSGSYHHGEQSTQFHSESDNQSVRVPGMQIIGFVNHLVGKAPNPLPDLKDADFQ